MTPLEEAITEIRKWCEVGMQLTLRVRALEHENQRLRDQLADLHRRGDIPRELTALEKEHARITANDPHERM